jgi:hypothetical protein
MQTANDYFDSLIGKKVGLYELAGVIVACPLTDYYRPSVKVLWDGATVARSVEINVLTFI